MPRVYADELDVAAREGKVQLGRRNAGKARCVVCGILCLAGTARRLWVDGFLRGSICAGCGKVAES